MLKGVVQFLYVFGMLFKCIKFSVSKLLLVLLHRTTEILGRYMYSLCFAYHWVSFDKFLSRMRTTTTDGPENQIDEGEKC